MNLPLLLPPPSDFEGTQLLASLSGYPCKKRIEPVGKSYERLVKRILFGEFEQVESTKVDDKQDDEEDETTQEQKAKYEAKRHKKEDKHLLHAATEDYYEIMGLGHLRWKATEAQIKSAYKKLVLKYHPDKNLNIDDAIFKKISEANDVLSNPKQRRIYDSEEDFDDSFPSSCDPKAFFSTYGPIFKRFSKWSVKTSVPDLGNEDTPIEQVKKFYDFWYSFKSWRDFSFDDEFDTKDAETREERRWMERQNERERKKKKKEESLKVHRLTETAEKQDPRIIQHRENMKKKREEAKKAKAEAIRKKKEEEERIAALEREKQQLEEKKKAEEIAQQKKQKAAENKKLRKARNRLRSVINSAPISPSVQDIETLCLKLSLDQLNELSTLFEKQDASAKDKFYQLLKKDESSENKKEEQTSSKPKSMPWTDEELSLLAQGVAKFPGGLKNRWQLIAEFVGTRSVNEIIAKCNETKSVTVKQNLDISSQDEFSKFKKAKKKTDKTIKKQQDVPVTKTEASPVERTVTQKDSNPENWTAEEQKALEKALQTFPASTSERWDKIADSVPGRSKKECIQRYKYLVAKIKEKNSKNA